MTRLGTVISQAIVHHYGRDEFLRRLAHPFWFQSFGAVMGMDWHSSGITTSVLGALKRGLQPLGGELGLHVCGGRGRHSRLTPQELAGDRRPCRPRWRGAGAVEPAGRQGRQRGGAGRLRSLPARLHRRRRRQMGGRAAGHERREPPGAALSLAVGRADELRRPAARRDRGQGRGRDRQPDRPSRRGVAPRPARPSAVAGAGRHNGRAGEAWRAYAEVGPAAAATARAAASRDAGPSRRAPCGREPAASARQSRRRGRPRAERLRRAAAGAGRRRAHGEGAGDGRRGDPRRALPLRRSRRVSRSPMAARIAIRFRCRSASTTRRSAC